MILRRSGTFINICASCTLITTNPIRTGLESNPHLPPYRDSRWHVKSEKAAIAAAFYFIRKWKCFR